MKNLPEPPNTSLIDGDPSSKSSTDVTTRYSLAKEKEALNLRYKGTQEQVDTNN